MDTNLPIIPDDVTSRFYLSGGPDTIQNQEERESCLKVLSKSWSDYASRGESTDEDWIRQLSSYLTSLADARIQHVRLWLSVNLQAFPSDNPSITSLHRTADTMFVDLK